jgi:outer membrane biosynthesis protein TonB
MNKSLIVSASIHGAILAAALFALPSPEPFKVAPVDAVQVDISQITDQSKRKATTVNDAKKSEKPAPEKVEISKDVKPAPKVAEEIKTAVKEPVAEEKPPEPMKEDPKKEAPKKVEEKPLDSDPLKELLATEAKLEAEKKKVEEQNKADDEKKAVEQEKAAEQKKADEKKTAEKKLADKKKKKQSFEDIAAFLNKEDIERTAPQKPTDKTGNPDKAEANAQGSDDALAATLVDALVSKVRGCFNVPAAARDADISVRVKFQLAEDGSVISVEALPSSDPIVRATAAAAVSAIRGCEPYELPREKYDLWKDNTLDFNPNLLFGT